jgi:MFS family permease
LLSGTFIRFAAAVTVFGLAGASFMIHLFPVLTDKGMSGTMAASVAGAMGVALIVGKLTLGSIFDRVGQVPVTLTLMAMFAVASAILAQASGSVPLAITGCVILGLAAGAFQVAIACIAARLFDSAIFGTIYGTITSLQTLAAACGPLLVSKLHDATGTYAPAFWAGVGIAGISALLLLKLEPVGSPEVAA